MLTIKADTSASIEMLDGIAERVTAQDVLSLAGEMLADYEREVFKTKGRGRWKALNPLTVRRKKSGRILVNSGRLLKALTTPSIEDDHALVTARSGGITDRGHIARFQRDGARGAPKRNPAPKPTPAHRERWAEDLVGFLVNGERP